MLSELGTSPVLEKVPGNATGALCSLAIPDEAEGGRGWQKFSNVTFFTAGIL